MAGKALKLAAQGFSKEVEYLSSSAGGRRCSLWPPGFDPDHRAPLLRNYGSLVSQLGGVFRTGPDVGTTPTDVDIIAERGAPYVVGPFPAHI